jgi:hypothetical protein
MIVDWIYNNPTWLWGSIFVFGAVIISCLGLTLFHYFSDVRVRRAHNDLTGFVLGLIGVVYAVLLAFIAVATWESFSAAGTTVQEEAGYVDNLYRDTRGFPPNVGGELQHALRAYTDIVINEEWPTQMHGIVPVAGWRALHKLHKELVTYQPETRGEAVIEAEFLRNLNDLYKARQARLIAATEHVPIVVWSIIIIGGAITTGFTYLFGFENFRLHLTMTGALAGSLTLVIVLIVALDWPLRGEVSVPPEAFVNAERGWGVASDDNDSTPAPAGAADLAGHDGASGVKQDTHH